MKRVLLVVVMSFSVVACAGTPPVTHSFESSRVYHADFNKVWQCVIEAFAQNNIPIKTLDKNSGFVASEYQYLPFTTRPWTKIVRSEYCDCGGPTRLTYYRELHGNFNVFVKSEGKDEISVQINAFFRIQILSALDDHPMGWQNCTSTGAFEQKFFSVLDNELRK